MSEGIEFLLELQADIEGATKMVRELTKVEAATYQADAALKAAEKHTGMLGQAFHKGKEWAGEFGHEVGSSFTSMFSAMAVWDGVKEGVHLLTELGGEALKTAGEAQRTRLSFQAMMGVEPANEVLEYIEQLARHTEFTGDEIRAFSAQLIRAGYSGDELKRALGGVIDMAAISQHGIEGAAQATELLTRVALRGGIGIRELSGAGIKAADFYKHMAAQLGIGVKAVEEQLQQGKIDVKVLREALYREIVKPGAQLGDAGIAMSETFLAKLHKAQDIVPQLFQGLETSGGLTKITEALSKLVDAFDPSAPAGKKLVAGLEHMIDWFGKFVSSIDFDKVADRAVSAMGFIEKAVEYGSAALEVLIALNPMRWLSVYNDAVVGAVGSVADFLSGLLDTATRFVGDIWAQGSAIGTALWEGLKVGLLSKATEVANVIAGIGDSMVGSLKGVLGIHSPSRVFAQLGAQTAAGFQLGIAAGVPDIDSTIEHAFGAPAVADLGGRGSGGDTSFAPVITINFGGAAPRNEREARELGEEMGSSIMEQLMSFFEQRHAQGGG